MPCSLRIRLIVLRPILWPTFPSAPRSLVYPQRGFSFAILTSSLTTSDAFRGRPGFRLPLPSYFRATRSR